MGLEERCLTLLYTCKYINKEVPYKYFRTSQALKISLTIDTETTSILMLFILFITKCLFYISLTYKSLNQCNDVFEII